ncbi:ZIP family metal transporter [Pedobacter sp. HMF7647]|uniref:ZIP family metal transporter n=1 Tax=Hufsiella arboris TaxID=2695275 RepID=A0A7K1YD44_9SPHI|nr:ZIP family metal transporter [Hufsiella arboris]MXV52504.1 ZIP family metal transporter [Hufsiella arboris]
MEYWKLILLFLSCFIGGISIFLFKKDASKQLKLLLSFSGAYLFSITAIHLMPEVFHTDDPTIGLYVLGGFLFQIVLEQFSDGIEHGHVHAHSHSPAFPWGIMVSLCLHAFLEGMPLAEGHQNELVFGIALHHIPASFALASVLVQSHVGKNKIIFLIVLFGLMSPTGYLLSHALSEGSILNLTNYFGRIMAVVIGIFLHISTTILFESSVDHHFNRKKLIAVLSGVSIALIGFLL